MLGWHLLVLLGIEVVAYGGVGWWLSTVRGWAAPAAALLAVSIYIAVRVVLIAAEFLLARRHGDVIPESLCVPPARLVAMYVREVGLWALMFSVVLPFVPARRSVVDRRMGSAPATATPPILLVHGLACNRANWVWFRPGLARAGISVYAMDYTPWFSSIDGYAPQLAAAIDEVLAATGSNKVFIVAHSMGGLVARAYLDQFGDAKVAHIVTLGTPHRGTWMTRFGFTPNVRDMALGSAWLTALEKREAARSPDPYAKFTCVFTYHDNLVTPQHTATLPGSAQFALSGIGHVSLAFSRIVLDRVIGAWRETNQASHHPEFPARSPGAVAPLR
jgi:pimeloyl-ACP methyl ester carboxylesterase